MLRRALVVVAAAGFGAGTSIPGALATVTVVAAQTAPDARHGLELARALCAGCHAVERGNLRSINPDAPAFSVVAGSPAMSEFALRALLRNSHRRMPDIVLTPGDRADVVAYILGLKGQ
jgi:mono/diheme cytochrome c family protein